MKIAELLQNDEYDARVAISDDRWLIGTNGIWIVYERKRHQRKTRIIVETNSEDLAVEKLIED